MTQDALDAAIHLINVLKAPERYPDGAEREAEDQFALALTALRTPAPPSPIGGEQP